MVGGRGLLFVKTLASQSLAFSGLDEVFGSLPDAAKSVAQ